MKLLIASAVAVLLASSCGDKKKDYSGAAGTCTTTMPVIGETCAAYSYSAKDQKEDPKATVQTQLETSCKAQSGTWSATGTCTTTGSLGSCSLTSTSGDATVTGSIYYYTSEALTTEIVQASCTSDGGTFTAP
jgi:hypothetical protein